MAALARLMTPQMQNAAYAYEADTERILGCVQTIVSRPNFDVSLVMRVGVQQRWKEELKRGGGISLRLTLPRKIW